MNAASRELSDTLTAYLAGWKSLYDCYVWLASVDWDDTDFDSDSKQTYGLFELLSTDVLKGFRGEFEFAQEASDFVAKATGARYVVQDNTTAKVSEFASSSDSNVRSVIPVRIRIPAEQSWSISPLSATV